MGVVDGHGLGVVPASRNGTSPVSAGSLGEEPVSAFRPMGNGHPAEVPYGAAAAP